VRGSNGAAYWKQWDGTKWLNWVSLGGVLLKGTGPGGFVFVQGTDHQLWHKEIYGGSGWTAWGTLGGKPPEALSTASPAAVFLPNLHTLVCVSSTSGNVWYSGNDVSGHWVQWDSVGSPP
jgi:hypothetical protein